MQTHDYTKEKTPVEVDEGLWIGPHQYELYNKIIHSGKIWKTCFQRTLLRYG